MASRQVAVGEIVKDIRGGMEPEAFIEKYQISSKKLTEILNKLKEKGALQEAEINAWLFLPMPKTFKCPACNFSYSGTFEECPKCGMIISKYQPTLKKQTTPHDVLVPPPSGYCSPDPRL